MPEKTKRAYKVVREDNGAWKSAVIHGGACVTYVLGERGYGFEGTPVTVFLSPQKARSWMRGFPAVVISRLAVLRGEAANPRRQTKLAAVWVGLDSQLPLVRLRRFWERGDKYRGELLTCPSGTHAADWFEPEKVVR